MLNRLLLKSVLAAAAAVVTGASARADFVIDTFTTPSPVVSYSLAGPVGSTYGQTDALAGGITRNLTVVQTQNNTGFANQTSGYIGATPSGGAFALSTATNTTSYATLLYTYNAGPQNISAAGSAVVFTGQADLLTPYSVTVSDGTNTATVSGTVNSTTATTFSVPTTGFAGVDLSNVKSIELVLNGILGSGGVDTSTSKTSADIALSDVRITSPNLPPPSVPAPPAAVLLLAAAPALGLTRFLRRKTTAA